MFDALFSHGVYHAGSKGIALVVDAIEHLDDAILVLLVELPDHVGRVVRGQRVEQLHDLFAAAYWQRFEVELPEIRPVLVSIPKIPSALPLVMAQLLKVVPASASVAMIVPIAVELVADSDTPKDCPALTTGVLSFSGLIVIPTVCVAEVLVPSETEMPSA